jgi:hypothetical protein
MGVRIEERMASLLAAGGLIWAAKVAAATYSQMPAVTFPLGPLEVCSIGVAVWLHAKWRRSVRLH